MKKTKRKRVRVLTLCVCVVIVPFYGLSFLPWLLLGVVEYSFQFGGFSASQSSSSGAPAATPSFSLPPAPRFSIQAPAPVTVGGGGEESEEGSDEEEEQEGGESKIVTDTPTLKVSTPVAISGEDSEEEDEREGEDTGEMHGSAIDLESKSVKTIPTASECTDAAVQENAANTVQVLKSAAVPARQHQPQKPLPAKMIEDDDEQWQLDGSIDGIEAMSDAIVRRLQPSLDDSIQRILELTESQQVRECCYCCWGCCTVDAC